MQNRRRNLSPSIKVFINTCPWAV